MQIADLWTVPGLWLFSAFIGEGEAFDDEAAVHLSPALGAVFWLTIALAAYCLVLLARRGWSAPARPWRFNGVWLWGAAWRAQLVHVFLYALAPLVWEAGRAVLITVFLPLMILGFGDTSIRSTDGTLAHLRQPTCWTFVTFCAGPRSAFLNEPVQNLSECTVERGCPAARARVRDFGGWGWKLLWLLLTVGWLALSPLRRSARFPRTPP